MSAQYLESLEWINVKRDPSTGLGTLVTLFEVLEQFLQNSRGATQPVSLLHIDIDHLTRLNRIYGYIGGDEIISDLILTTRRLLRELSLEHPIDELLYRIGGDEFAVLLPSLSMRRATEVAEILRVQVCQGVPERIKQSVTLSVGVASVPDNAHDLGSLITAADMGVLEAKQRGGDRVFASMKDPLRANEMVVASRIINTLARRMVETGALLEEAQQVALTDPVSGLPNFRAMHRFLEREHQRASRYQRPYSLLLVDGDSLKKINDQLGHEAGNKWIRQLSRLLVQQTRSTDLVARWFAGDEFVVVLTETQAHDALLTAERIRAQVEKEGQYLAVPATVSIGGASFPQDGMTVKELLEYADQANSAAKRLGRNRVVFYRNPSEPADSIPPNGETIKKMEIPDVNKVDIRGVYSTDLEREARTGANERRCAGHGP